MVGREGDGQHVLSFHFCLLYVRLMAEFDVDGPLWVVVGRFGGLCGWSWNGLGAVLDQPWAVMGCQGRFWLNKVGWGVALCRFWVPKGVPR